MKKKRFIKKFLFVFLLLLLALALLLFLRLRSWDTPAKPGSQQTAVPTASAEPETPVPVSQLVEEFNEQLEEGEEPVTEEDFSEFTEDYAVEVQEDEVVTFY